MSIWEQQVGRRFREMKTPCDLNFVIKKGKLVYFNIVMRFSCEHEMTVDD